MWNQIEELEVLVADANSLTIGDNEQAELIATLRPIADNIPRAIETAQKIVVENSAQAEQAALLIDSWKEQADQAEKAIRNFGSDGGGIGLLERLHLTHRRGTALISACCDKLRESAKFVKQQRVIPWQNLEAEKAEAERQKLQAIADEAARKERERLEKLAASRKTPEVVERYREQAAAVVAPVVHVAPPSPAVKSQTRTVVAKCDLVAMGIPQSIVGYFKREFHPDGRFRCATLSAETLCSAKSANSLLEVPGVVFGQKIV